jgi:hypothetical protein
MGDVIRHPRSIDVRNARARSRWAWKYFSGVHFADMRTVELYRKGEWIALQQSWRRRALDEQATNRTVREGKV